MSPQESGQVVLVTGSTRGIGRAVAAELLARGVRVAVHGRDPARVAEVCRELHEERALPFAANLAEAESAARLVRDVHERCGGLHALVNNAGGGKPGAFRGLGLEQWRSTMSLNLEAAFLAPEPISPNRPVIVIVAVIFGFALGLGIGVLLEAADPTIHNARQLQASFNLPVLVAIPEILLETDRMKQRRARVKNAVATAAIVVAVWPLAPPPDEGPVARPGERIKGTAGAWVVRQGQEQKRRLDLTIMKQKEAIK